MRLLARFGMTFGKKRAYVAASEARMRQAHPAGHG